MQLLERIEFKADDWLAASRSLDIGLRVRRVREKGAAQHTFTTGRENFDRAAVDHKEQAQPAVRQRQSYGDIRASMLVEFEPGRNRVCACRCFIMCMAGCLHE